MADVFLLSRIFLFALFLTKTSGKHCTCKPIHPQTAVCSQNGSDFVFTGRVLEETFTLGKDIFGNFQYRLDVIDIIKGINESLRSNVTIQTPVDKHLCGIRLKIGDIHLLSGFLDGSAKVVTSCDMNLNFNNLSQFNLEQHWEFYGEGEKSYKDNCDCQITSIVESASSNMTSNVESPPSNMTKGCQYPEDQQSCYFRTGLCKKDGDKCAWEHVKCD